MERGCGIRARVPKEDPYRFSHFSVQRVLLREGIYCAVEHEIFGIFLHKLCGAELLQACLALGHGGVDFPLHDVELVIHMKQPALWFDQDQAVHAVSDVLSNHWCPAMIEKQPGRCGLKRKSFRLPWDCLRECRAATWTERSMKIDRVHHMTGGIIAKSDLNRVTLSHTDHGARHFSAESPIAVPGASRRIQLSDNLLRRESNVEHGRCSVRNRRRNISRITHDVGNCRSGLCVRRNLSSNLCRQRFYIRDREQEQHEAEKHCHE